MPKWLSHPVRIALTFSEDYLSTPASFFTYGKSAPKNGRAPLNPVAASTTQIQGS